MKGKIICSEDDLEGICLDGVVDVGEVIQIQIRDDDGYYFNKDYYGLYMEGWVIRKEFVKILEEN